MTNTSILAAFERMWRHITAAFDGKSDTSHNHDDSYYTEPEIDTKLSEVNSSILGVESHIINIINGTEQVGRAEQADTADNATKATQDANGNVITDTYETKNDASDKLTEAKSYTDTQTSLVSNTVADNKISAHNTSKESHNDIRVLINDLDTQLSNFLNVDDETVDQLSEVLALIENNRGTLESLTTSKVNVSDIIDNLTTASASRVLSANQGVVLKSLIDTLQLELDSHSHEIADVNGLQDELDNKSDISHVHENYEDNIQSLTDNTVKYGDALLTTNPFGGKRLYISKIDNSLYCADKRWDISMCTYKKEDDSFIEDITSWAGSQLFNGTYEGGVLVYNDRYLVITIDYGDSGFPGYGYGTYYLTSYWGGKPKTVKARLLSSNDYWVNFDINYLVNNSNQQIAYFTNNYYHQIKKIELTVVSYDSEDDFVAENECSSVRGDGSSLISELELQLTRPDPYRQPILNKYQAETLYYPLTAPSFIGNLTGTADNTTKLETARTFQTNLESTSSATFDGTNDVTIGVAGILPIANGGTGADSAEVARTNLEVYSKSEIDDALNNLPALTINNTTYNGSAAVDLTEIINAMIDAKIEASIGTITSDYSLLTD